MNNLRKDRDLTSPYKSTTFHVALIDYRPKSRKF